jgi:predicted aspartyl protease
MQIEFQGNSLITKFVIYGNNNIRQDYIAYVDTGATKTAIPLSECARLGLEYAGDYNASTAGGTLTFPLFYAVIEICGRRFDTQIAGFNQNVCLLGTDILSNYRVTIDWRTNPKQAHVEG